MWTVMLIVWTLENQKLKIDVNYTLNPVCDERRSRWQIRCEFIVEFSKDFHVSIAL